MNKFLQQLDINPTLEWKFVLNEHEPHARNLILLHGDIGHKCTTTFDGNSNVRTHVLTATTNACVPVDLQLRIMCKPTAGSYFLIESIWCDSVNLWENYRNYFCALPSTVSVADSRVTGPCVLKFVTDDPFYQWLHSVDQLGWLLQPVVGDS